MEEPAGEIWVRGKCGLVLVLRRGKDGEGIDINKGGRKGPGLLREENRFTAKQKGGCMKREQSKGRSHAKVRPSVGYLVCSKGGKTVASQKRSEQAIL